MIKQVIVIRKDLNMRRGKEIAQGSHASSQFLVEQSRPTVAGWLLIFFARLLRTFGGVIPSDRQLSARPFDKDEHEWLDGLFTKVCLRVNSETELVQIYDNAKQAGLKTYLIIDSGKTEFNGEPTKTAVAIGPGCSEKIDAITGSLSLY